jgi:hypothetical protein
MSVAPVIYMFVELGLVYKPRVEEVPPPPPPLMLSLLLIQTHVGVKHVFLLTGYKEEITGSI